jgi:serine carboxypeptidase-like clade 2
MHANVTKLAHNWEPSSDVLTRWLDSPSTIIPLPQEFMASGLEEYRLLGKENSILIIISIL